MSVMVNKLSFSKMTGQTVDGKLHTLEKLKKSTGQGLLNAAMCLSV